MLKTTGMLCLMVLSGWAVAGPVYRCPGANGVILYTDRDCAGGQEIEEHALQPNLFTGAPIEESRSVVPRASRGKSRGGGPGSCNNAADLRSIDLMLKSLATDRPQKSFLKAERRRVQNCELEKLSADERNRRDAALRRIRSLRDSEREEAKTEIESLYRSRR